MFVFHITKLFTNSLQIKLHSFSFINLKNHSTHSKLSAITEFFNLPLLNFTLSLMIS